MSRDPIAVLGEVHETPIPAMRTDEVRDALARSDCSGVARRGDLLVKITARALRAIEEAARSASPLSCAGAMLGTVSQVGETWFVDIREAVAFQATPEEHRVRVPRHAWQEMLAVRSAHFSDLRVVGWYHSHPGLGVNVSEADVFVQRYFFPADWQVACVIDPQRRDVQFFSRRGRSVSALGAFWVERGGVADDASTPRSAAAPSPPAAQAAPPAALFAPAAAQSEGRFTPLVRGREGRPAVPQQPETFEGQQSSETFLKERFVERSLEKILKTLKEPPLMARDYVLMGLMGLMLVVLVLTRLGGSTSSAQLKEITQRLDAISERLDTMEMGGAAPAKKPLAPRPRASTRAEVLAPDRTRPVAATEKLPSGAPSAEPAVQDADSDHVMKPGETLWNVAEQYYADGSLMTALMRYNKIRDARDLAVGATIKVPPVERLRAQAEPSGGGVTVPPPTPH